MNKHKIAEYDSIADLPEAIRTTLPEPAQELYRAVYNRELEKHHASGGYANERELRKIADQAAWRRVAMEYQQDQQGRWQRDPLGAKIDPDKPASE